MGQKDLEDDVFGLDFVLRSNEDCRPFDCIAQFTDIPRPAMLGEDLERFARDRDSGAESAGEGDGQVFQVTQAIAQGRKLNGKNGQAVIEVFAKLLLRDTLLQVGIGRRDYADIDFEVLVPSKPLDLALFEEPEDFALQREGHIADFVEEERASMRRVDAPDARLYGAGEGALGKTEEF